MTIEIEPEKAVIEINIVGFARKLTDKQALEIVRAICEETLCPIRELRKIVNSDMYDI